MVRTMGRHPFSLPLAPTRATRRSRFRSPRRGPREQRGHARRQRVARALSGPLRQPRARRAFVPHAAAAGRLDLARARCRPRRLRELAWTSVMSAPIPPLEPAWLEVIDRVARRVLGPHDRVGTPLVTEVRHLSALYTRDRAAIRASSAARAARLRFFLPRDLPKIEGPLTSLAARGQLPSKGAWRVVVLGACYGATTLGLGRLSKRLGLCERLEVCRWPPGSGGSGRDLVHGVMPTEIAPGPRSIRVASSGRGRWCPFPPGAASRAMTRRRCRRRDSAARSDRRAHRGTARRRTPCPTACSQGWS